MRRVMAFLSAAALVVAGAVAMPSTAAAQEQPTEPRFSVDFPNLSMEGSGWLPNTGVTITADDPATRVSPDFTLTLTTDDVGGYSVPQIPGIAPGWFVTVTDSDSIRTHTVRNLTINYLNLDTNVVHGTADPNSLVEWVGGPLEGEGVPALADSSGDWSADVSAVYDLKPGVHVVAAQTDMGIPQESGGVGPGGTTLVSWLIPTTLDELFDNLIADGQLPNAGIATSIMKLATGKAPVKALTSQLSGLVRAGKITQVTMDQILATVTG